MTQPELDGTLGAFAEGFERAFVREPAAWSWPGWALRRLVVAIVCWGEPRCKARRCGCVSASGDGRWCCWHHDALLAEFGPEREQELAKERLRRRSRWTQRRLRGWALGMAEAHGHDVYNLVRLGYVPRGPVGELAGLPELAD